MKSPWTVSLVLWILLLRSSPSWSEISNGLDTSDSSGSSGVPSTTGKEYDDEIFEKILSNEEDWNRTSTDFFVVHLHRDNDLVHMSNHSGIKFIRKIFADESLYLFRRSPDSEFHEVLRDMDNDKIKWIYRQEVLKRYKRHLTAEDILADLIPDSYHAKPLYFYNSHQNPYVSGKFFHSVKRSQRIFRFNDPLFRDQWYLKNDYQLEGAIKNDINVLPAWKAGFTGHGVRVSILDDGVFKKNIEVAENYDDSISHDFAELQLEGTIEPNSHGTYCAAIVAGVANNNYCGIGVAYGAKIGGVRILNSIVTDAQEAMGAVQALPLVDIYSASWGPKDDGKHVAGPGPLTRRALHKGVTKGRNGKGSIYVWAAGNGGGFKDNCNLDGYASSPYTLTFGALTEEGKSTYYTEPCASVIASTYVGGLHHPPNKNNLALYQRMIKVIVPDTCGKCRENFQGTSAAAPIAAGVIALILEANPRLTWRDVQHVVIQTARIPYYFESGWSLNSAGRHFHPKIGFGVMDASRAVAVAQNWNSVGPLHRWSTKRHSSEIHHIQPFNTTTVAITTRNGQNRIIETTVATVDITHPRCGNLEMFLTSPSGTISQLLTKRPHDVTTKFRKWDFTSLHFWGESSVGTWRLDINSDDSKVGTVSYFKLKFYGGYGKPRIRMTPVQNISTNALKDMMEREERIFRSINIHPLQ